MNTIETKVLEIIGESTDSPDVFTDDDAGMAPVRDSLNDAIQEIVSLTGSRSVKYMIPLRQEQAFYRFSTDNGYLGWVTDAFSINNGIRLNQTDIINLNAYDLRWMTTTGDPRSYLQIGHDVIGFWPKPGSTSNTVELNIVEIPKSYADGQRVNLRDDFEYAAINYAVAEYWASRGDAKSALDHFQRYLGALGLADRFNLGEDKTYFYRTQKETA